MILASRSPRRRRLLEEAGYAVDVRPSGADETPPPGAGPEEAAVALALRKARAVAAEGDVDAPVVAADTAVVLGDRVLGIPADPVEAAATLRALSGRRHAVVTGVAVIHPGGRERTGARTTHVTFRDLDDDEIRTYVDSGEPMDKAGAYGVQGGAADFVEDLEGARDNVIGLPVDLVRELLT